MTRPCLFFILLGLVVQGTYSQDTALEEGASIANRECQQCHGDQGLSSVKTIPSIGGYSETAMLDLLQGYQNNNRPAYEVESEDGSTSTMLDVMEKVSASDLVLVAKYYASLTWQPIDQSFDATLARQGSRIHRVKCGKCHIREGSIPDADLAILSGQWRDYLEQQFQDFDSRARRMVSKMQQKYDTLSGEDKKALLELYVSAGNY